MEIHPSYQSALRIGIVLQVAVLAFFNFGAYHLFPFALIPAVVYSVITPLIVFCHPQPTGLGLQLVRSGYFYYCLLAIFGASAYNYALR